MKNKILAKLYYWVGHCLCTLMILFDWYWLFKPYSWLMHKSYKLDPDAWKKVH